MVHFETETETVNRFESIKYPTFDDYCEYWREISMFYKGSVIIFSTCGSIFRPCKDYTEVYEWLSGIEACDFTSATKSNFQNYHYIILDTCKMNEFN